MPSFRFLLLVTAMLPASIGRTQNQAGHADFTAGDRLAIKNVIASHFLYLDGFRIDKWMTNFTDDATFVVELGTKRFAFDQNRRFADTNRSSRPLFNHQGRSGIESYSYSGTTGTRARN